ncbi:hypothetical protein P775_11175 [Puniceibacterium antarcticum]|uniref:ORC1/DEAH AAA+ ATPase domain-containing protein n=1 Tax=Puniceibacterium antarcticum TaxID=1206336 RepID=A0A2G8RGK6_9RHOB|nr:ATP-binding protein [Puniceibacterium antarcticum]PIL20218.1 hypothetical protein P775_11175 [Puniceibacterium antarcticum]
MKPGFVETRNVRNFMTALSAVEERGAVEASMVVVDGEPGLGKTTMVSRWVAQTGSIYLRADEGWNYSFLIKELLNELSIKDPHRTKYDRHLQVKEALNERISENEIAGKQFGIVIDECDLVSSRKEIMETLRGFSDRHEIPVILVGMGRLRDNLRRFPQIESRAPRKVRFMPANIEDTKALISGRCEVPVADDLARFVCKVSRGFNREILEAIAHIERFGLRSECGAEGVTLADMQGQVIMSDRNSGNAIVVPEAA